MGRGYLVVEGHGDGQAALNLVVRRWNDLGFRTDAMGELGAGPGWGNA